jgi:hypothetical protein
MKVVLMRGGKKIILVRVNIEHARAEAKQRRVSDAVALRGGSHLAPMYPA